MDVSAVQQKLAQVPGVGNVVVKEVRATSAIFETESRKGELRRGDLARAVIAGGWDLNEMRPAAMSLEEIFLRLTGSESAAADDGATEPETAQPADPPGEAAKEAAISDAEEPHA